MTSPWRYKKKVKIYKYRALGDNERHVIDYGTEVLSYSTRIVQYDRLKLPLVLDPTEPYDLGDVGHCSTITR